MKLIDHYHKWVEWNDEDQIYIGKCPDLMTGIHGNDPIKLYEELNLILEEIIDHYKLENRKLPSPTVRPMKEVH